MNFFRKLQIPDYISLVGLLFAWLSIRLILSGEPNQAIMVMLVAFIFDLLDGYWARKLDRTSALGRQVDSYVDIFTYLVFSALFFNSFLSPYEFVSILVGFLILTFGGLRLIRFNSEGILSEDGRKFYRGVIVVYINLVIVCNYFLQEFVPYWNQWFSALTVATVCPFMLSNYKTHKVEKYWMIALIIISISALVLFLEYGY